jgi:ATP-dependent Lon protease
MMMHGLANPKLFSLLLFVLGTVSGSTAPNYLTDYVNLLKPTGYVMHQQFNIQQLYVLPTLYLCVLYLSENKQRLVPLTE